MATTKPTAGKTANQFVLSKVSFDLKQMKAAKNVFRAILHDERKKILKFIEKKVSVRVSDIYKELAMEQSVVSQFLSILRGAELVKGTRKGKEIYYSINTAKLNTLKKATDVVLG
jgi:ArsR family transcriptional regulator